jgi:hypothetical protein
LRGLFGTDFRSGRGLSARDDVKSLRFARVDFSDQLEE